MKILMMSCSIVAATILLSACGATSSNDSTSEAKTTLTSTKPNQKAAVNLLAFANTDFETPIDNSLIVTRNDHQQVNLAQFEVIPEAAKESKYGLGVSLERGGLKFKFPLDKIANDIDENAQYRLEADTFLVESEAMLWTMTASNQWKNQRLSSATGWHNTGINISGKHLSSGAPLIFHLDNIKGQKPAIIFVDNIRLIAL
jgi:hypothetical protein